MQKTKKSLIVAIMMMTVLSTCLVSAPNVKAATNGDLIKMDGLSSVYYLANGKRYVFPNAATYFSWYPDFNGVKTIAQSELESFPLAANVTVRPGTKLVKSPTNPLVYAVEPGGVLRSIVSEQNAINLYGANWAKRVIDIVDSFFTNYTNSGNPLTVGMYPVGSLIKTASSPDVYLIGTGGVARKFGSEAAFVGNRFSFDNVLTATTIPTLGDPVTGTETALTDTSSGAGGTPATNSGSGLTVGVAGDTAPSRNIPSFSTLVPFMSVNLTASTDGDSTVNTIVFTRKGTGAASDFSGGYLYLGNDRLTTKRSVNTSDNTLTFSALNLVIPSGMTKQLVLKMDAKTTDVVSGNHYFEITKASNVSTNGATVSGSFPMDGNTMTYSTVHAATVTLTGENNEPTYKIGDSNVIISEFTMQNDSYEDVTVRRLRFKQNEDASDEAVTGFNLDLDGTIVSQNVSMVGRYVDFILDTPFLLKKSKSITATVRGNVVGDIGKKVELYFQNTTDLEVAGSAYGDFYSANVNVGNFTTGVGQSDDLVTINGSSVNVSFDGPAAADVKNNSTNTVLANFKILSSNQDVNFEKLRILLNNGAKNNFPMTNIEMVDSANSASYSVSDPSATTSPTALDFENILLQKGVQYNFQVRGDIPDGEWTGATFAVSINFNDTTNVKARYQDANQTLVATNDYSTSGLDGKLMTVAAPAVAFAKVTTSNSSVVKSAKNVLLYKGKVYANDVDSLKLSKVKLNAKVGWNNAQNLSIDYDRLYFYQVNADGTETKLDDESALTQTYVSFSGFTAAIPAGVSNGVTFVVRGDVKASPAGTTTKLAFDPSASNFTVKDSDSNTVTGYTPDNTDGQTTTVVTQGAYTMAIDTDLTGLNTAKNVLAGTSALLGRVKLTASKENVLVQDLVLQNIGTATNDTLATLYLYDNANMTGTTLGSTDVAADGKAKFTGLNITVPTTGSTYLYVAGLIKPIDYSNSPSADATAEANKDIALRIPADSSATGYVTKVSGKDTGEILDNTFDPAIKTSSSTVMGAVISALTTSFTDKTLGSGIKDIFSFKVTAPASTDVDFNGDPLAVKLGTVIFTTASSNVSIVGLKVERTGGSGEKTVNGTLNGTTFTIDFPATYTTDSDLKVKPGETAEYTIRATVAAPTSNASLSVSIENVNTSVPYTHNTGVNGIQGADAGPVYPLISGTTFVRGGTLTN